MNNLEKFHSKSLYQELPTKHLIKETQVIPDAQSKNKIC